MTRKFINQEDLSNKFWNIEYEGTTQKVVFGKIGTEGRTTIKEFSSQEECIKESEKLIAQKLKKGYVEWNENTEIPQKVEMNEEEKADFIFWEAIEKSYKYNKKKWDAYDVDEHLEKLTAYLAKFGKERLVSFEKTLREKLIDLYTAPIAELYLILHSDFKEEKGRFILKEDRYISDDGFLYFRCWLLLKGKEFFQDITQDINAFISGKYHFDIGDCWGEGLLYVADEAYAENHDNEDESEIRDAVDEVFPHLNYDSGEFEMEREPLYGKALQEKYPELTEELLPIR